MPANLSPAKEQHGPEQMLHAKRGEGIDNIHAEQNWSPIRRLRVCQRELRLPKEPIYPNICYVKREKRAVSTASSQEEKWKEETGQREIPQPHHHHTGYS